MADLAIHLHATPPPARTITFNDGDLGDGTDKYWIQAITGLDGPNMRAPVDLVPLGDGGLIHAFWLAGARPVLEGVFVIESVGDTWVGLPDGDERRLRTRSGQALESNVSASATLAWTPTGQSAQSLTVYHNGQPA